MALLTLNNVGNLPEDYKHESRKISFENHIYSSDLIMKYYTMYKDKPYNEEMIKGVRQFILDEIRNEKIKPYIGLGFTILSDGAINVARWDNKEPIVLMNSIYTFSNNDISTITQESIVNIGAFCGWEVKHIVGHEASAWLNYISKVSIEKNPEKLEELKADYLRDSAVK